MTDPVAWMIVLHVLAGFWLAAGAFGGAIVRAQIRRSGSLAEKVAGLRIAARMQTLLVVPGSGLVGLLGIGLIHPRGWSFSTGWIATSVVLWVPAFVLAAFILLPEVKRQLRAGEAVLAGGDPAVFQAMAARKLPGILADLNATIVVVLTILMVLKPF